MKKYTIPFLALLIGISMTSCSGSWKLATASIWDNSLSLKDDTDLEKISWKFQNSGAGEVATIDGNAILGVVRGIEDLENFHRDESRKAVFLRMFKRIHGDDCKWTPARSIGLERDHEVITRPKEKGIRFRGNPPVKTNH